MRRQNSRALSVPELLLACFFVGLLTTFVFTSFHMGLRAVFKGQAHNELLSEIQIAARRIGEPMEQSSGLSVSIDQTPNEEALSYLTNVDEDGNSIFFPGGGPEWQAYLIFYFDEATNTMRYRRVNLIATAIQRSMPTQIEQYDPGSGPQDLSFYCTGGRQIARLINSFKLERLAGLPDAYEFTLRAFKPKVGNRQETSSALKWTIAVRN